MFIPWLSILSTGSLKLKHLQDQSFIYVGPLVLRYHVVHKTIIRVTQGSSSCAKNL